MEEKKKKIKKETNDAVKKILIVDDEDQFRSALAKQLTVRGYHVIDVNCGEEAIKAVRHESPKVIILDQKMPGMSGVETLKEIKKIKPEVQVIMLTGHGSTDLARITGKYDIFQFFEKPMKIEDLIKSIESAFQERVYAMARHEIPELKKSSTMQWLIGVNNSRPGIWILGAIIFLTIAYMPTPSRLNEILTTKKTSTLGEIVEGYSDYKKMKDGDSIGKFYAKTAKLMVTVTKPDGKTEEVPISNEKIAFRARVMVGILIITSLFWGTGALPIGVTSLLVGALMILFGVLTPNLVAQAYAKDAVIFIFGVLTIAMAISKTRLDRRLGILLLGTSNSLFKFAFIFGPLLAVSAGFLSEHALIAFLIPIILIVYMGAIKAAGIEKDKYLIVFLFLLPNFCANIGGPGSPAAGGRNAIMVGLLSDYGINISFGQWLKLGLPFVPVAAICVGLYFYFIVGRKIKLKQLDIAERVRMETKRLGKMTPDEYKAAGVLALLVILWVTMSDKLGMGGPTLICIILLNIMGILRWKDINNIHMDIVVMYGAADAIGYALAASGGALWLADSFISSMPKFMGSGTGLWISASLMTGILTNFMSDGATVATIGPITVPMGIIGGTNPIKVGLATAFSSSFAHCLLIGTPNNAITYAMAKDPETGEQLVTIKDLFVHGLAVLVISFAVLWLWAFYGYWQWIK
jgi:solute carrier family 13 (sodium-dependent dicarboxylate transporter), member 2/3/5